MSWYRSWPFLSGITLIVITNAVALGSAISNRRGAPESTLTLTERELERPFDMWAIRENSGLALRLGWQVERFDEAGPESRRVSYGNETDWLNESKLKELGIVVRSRSSGDSDSYSENVAQQVLLVLEMNGPVYQRHVERVCAEVARSSDKSTGANCYRERNKASRLFVVDAGRDREALRRKHPDTHMYAIVGGQVQGMRLPTYSDSRIVGRVVGLSVDEIQVPPSMRASFGAWPSEWSWPAAEHAQPFRATVAFGRRLEPWVQKVSSP